MKLKGFSFPFRKETCDLDPCSTKKSKMLIIRKDSKDDSQHRQWPGSAALPAQVPPQPFKYPPGF